MKFKLLLFVFLAGSLSAKIFVLNTSGKVFLDAYPLLFKDGQEQEQVNKKTCVLDSGGSIELDEVRQYLVEKNPEFKDTDDWGIVIRD